MKINQFYWLTLVLGIAAAPMLVGSMLKIDAKQYQHRQSFSSFAPPTASILCAPTAGGDFSQSATSGEVTVNGTATTEITFPTGIYSTIPANATNIKVALRTKIEILQNGLSFSDVITRIEQSPIPSFSGAYPDGGYTPVQAQPPGATKEFTIERTNVNPTGLWRIKTTVPNLTGAEINITFTIILSWTQPPQASDCDTTVCRSHSIKLFSVGHETVVAGHTYKWNTGETTPAITVTQSGKYTLTITNSTNETGVDDIDVLFKSKTSNFQQTICQGESVQVGSQIFTTAVTNTPVLLQTTQGCDSTVNVTVKVNPTPAPKRQTIQLCGNETYSIGTNTYDFADVGEHTDVLQTTLGCDSVVITTIVAADAKTKQNPQTICAGASYTINQHIYTQAGTYKDTLATAAGCDSIVTTILTVKTIEGTREQNIKICQGESYTFNNHAYNTEGIYKDTLDGRAGCDSMIVITHLKVLKPNPLKIVEKRICEGDSYTFNGHTYTEAGQYLDTIKYKTTNCDSVVVKTILNITEDIKKTIEKSICKGKTYVLGNQTLTQTGTYTATFTAASTGCDSIVTLKLTVEEKINTSQEKILCFGESFEGKVYEKDTTLIKEFIRPNDCDSIHTIRIDVLPKIEVKVTPLGNNCNVTGLVASATGGSGGFSFKWSNGSTSPTQTELANGTYTVTVTDAKGCRTVGTGTVGSSSGLKVYYEVEHILCNGGDNGEIHLEIEGTPPYVVEWGNGSHEQDLYNLKAGNYNLYVKDANGCIFGTTIQVKEPAKLKVEVVTTPSSSPFSGTATAIITGGTTPYDIRWSNGKTTAFIDGLTIGEYKVLVTDKNGCQANASGQVTTTTATHDLEGLVAMKLYPNPTSGRFDVEIELMQSQEMRLAVYDTQGRLLREFWQEGSRIVQPIDISEFANGTYLLLAEAKGKRTARRIALAK